MVCIGNEVRGKGRWGEGAEELKEVDKDERMEGECHVSSRVRAMFGGRWDVNISKVDETGKRDNQGKDSDGMMASGGCQGGQ